MQQTVCDLCGQVIGVEPEVSAKGIGRRFTLEVLYYDAKDKELDYPKDVCFACKQEAMRLYLAACGKLLAETKMDVVK